MKLKIYTDGGARGNPGPSAFGVVVCDSRDKVLYEYADTIGHATNNVAEYCGLIAGLEIAKKMKATEVDCTMDSALMMNQVSGNYKIKAPHLKELANAVKQCAAVFHKVTYRHQPREFPMLVRADKLVNKALDAGKLK